MIYIPVPYVLQTPEEHSEYNAIEMLDTCIQYLITHRANRCFYDTLWPLVISWRNAIEPSFELYGKYSSGKSIMMPPCEENSIRYRGFSNYPH